LSFFEVAGIVVLTVVGGLGLLWAISRALRRVEVNAAGPRCPQCGRWITGALDAPDAICGRCNGRNR